MGEHSQSEARDESAAERKVLNGYLIANWKAEDLKIRKTKPDAGSQRPHEFSIPVAIEIIVPDVEIPELGATVEVPRPSVEANLRSEDAEHADPEGWQAVADEFVEEKVQDGETVSYRDVYEVVGRVLTEVETYPDAADVENYVHETITEATGNDE